MLWTDGATSFIRYNVNTIKQTNGSSEAEHETFGTHGDIHEEVYTCQILV